VGDEIPSRIGKYDVDGIVGHGGMGIVYRGHDALGRQVAIKMVLASFLGESELIKRFQREAQFTANLHHPNIVTVYDWGQEGSSPFVVMEFLIGRSLDRWQFDGPPPMLLLKKLNIIEQVCAGLNYAHERKIVHRDIKPPNIFVLDDESVKLVDFGVARLTEGAGHGMTRTGQIIGSLYYMSPEQANGFKLDHRTDIFSAGVVLYELLSGVLPFAGRDTASTLIRILTASPQPLSELMGSCPPELEEVVLRALEKAPRDRYQTAEELALDLSQVQMQLRRQIGGEYLASAEAAMQRSDWLKAKEVLVELLKLDREHVRGLDMLREVQQIIRRQDRVSEAAGFKRQAEDAFEKRRFKDALELAEEAVSLDNSNYDLVVFRDEIRATLNRSEKARLAMDRAETSFHAQRLEAAQGAIDEALSLDPLNTSAQQLQGKIANALAEQFKRTQAQTLIGQAREELSGRKYSSAIVLLRKAESLHESALDLRPLLEQAIQGQERERRERELHRVAEEIRKLLSSAEWDEAESKLRSALGRYPGESLLVDLERQFSDQRRVEAAQRAVQRAELLVKAGNWGDAKAAVEEALVLDRSNPDAIELQGRVAQALSDQARRTNAQAILAQAHRALEQGEWTDAFSL
jgi:tetratricopeptide (TPR) repeat protein